MASSPRKTIKSNPLDSIASKQRKSEVTTPVKKTPVRHVNPEVTVQISDSVLPLAKADAAERVPQAKTVLPEPVPLAKVVVPVKKVVKPRRQVPSAGAPARDDATSASVFKRPAKKTPLTENESSKASSASKAQPAVEQTITAEQTLTAEDILEREFTPTTAMVMIPSDLFDDDRLVDAHALHTVKSWSQWAVLAGLIPAPVVDTVAISAIQIKMIHTLCKLYHVQFKKEAALAVVSGLVGGSLTTTLAGMGGVVLSHLPGIGSLMKYTAQPVLSYASTYALGRVFMRHFENHGTMVDIDSKKLETYFKEQYAKGRKMFKYDFKARQAQSV
jgi:uncharacterized protein (DUF697 family)